MVKEKHNTNFGEGHKRCNVCNFCNGIDGQRVMHKDPHDHLVGGYLCNECKNFPFGHTSYEHEKEVWFQEAKDHYEYDKSEEDQKTIEDLIDIWDKENC